MLVFAAATWGAFFAAQAQQRGTQGNPEKVLTGAGVIELSPGDHFAILVPLTLGHPINLGSAELRVTLELDKPPQGTGRQVVLLGKKAAASTLLLAGEHILVLHGVVPDLDANFRGASHASDYSVHFASGDGANPGTPDDRFIDTKRLNAELSALHFRLIPKKKD